MSPLYRAQQVGIKVLPRAELTGARYDAWHDAFYYPASWSLNKLTVALDNFLDSKEVSRWI